MAHEKAFVLVQATSHCPRCDLIVCGNTLDRDRDDVVDRKFVVEYLHDHTLTVKAFACTACKDQTMRVVDPHADVLKFTCRAARTRFDDDLKQIVEPCGGLLEETAIVDDDAAQRTREKADVQPDEVRWSSTFIVHEM